MTHGTDHDAGGDGSGHDGPDERAAAQPDAIVTDLPETDAVEQSSVAPPYADQQYADQQYPGQQYGAAAPYAPPQQQYPAAYPVPDPYPAAPQYPIPPQGAYPEQTDPQAATNGQPGVGEQGYQPRRYADPDSADAQPYGAPQYSDQQYAAQQYPDQQYAAQQYPDQQYAAQQYPDTQQFQPQQQYPDQQYPDQQYPDQQYQPQQQYPAQQYQPGHYQQPQGDPGQYAQPGFAPPPALPAPIPRPEDLLVPDQSPVTAEPASHGWRGRVNRVSGGLIKAKAAESEIQLRQAISDIQRGFSRPMTVVVVQPKGGAGKTPTTICLSAAFGAHRGGYVVGWDDNETRGTLAVRVSNPDSQRATVWDLLSDLAAFERFDARVGDLSFYVRPQPDAHFDALVSDDNPGNMAQIGEEEFRRLHTVLQRFYRLIVVDTGNNVRSPNWQAAVNSADLVVVVSTYQRDVGYSGSWVLDHLAQTGREDLARNAVTVLTAADPAIDKTVRAQLMEHFSARTRAVVEIPYDREVAHGGPIRWAALGPETRNAWIHAGATIANALADHDQRTLAERRA